MQMLLFGYAINFDVRNLRAAVVDDAGTSLSRAYVAALQASGVVEFAKPSAGVPELQRRMNAGEIKVGIHIPPDFERRVLDSSRPAAQLLVEYGSAQRKLKDSRPPKEVAEDIQAQLQRLMPKRFMLAAPYAQLQHMVRYLRAVTLRLDKLKADPARDAARLAELRPLEQRWLRRLGELKGAGDARLDEYRWLLEELRVSFFAQELRTPQPVSAKRLDKAWAQLAS